MQANEGTKRNARQEGEGLVVGTPAMSETIIGVTDSHTSRRNCPGHLEYRLRHRWRERLGHHLPEDLMAGRPLLNACNDYSRTCMLVDQVDSCTGR